MSLLMFGYWFFMPKIY